MTDATTELPVNCSRLPVSCSRLIVCERHGRWADMLRRRLPDRGRWIVEIRGFGQLHASVGQHPASLCVLAVQYRNLDRASATIESLHRSRPRCHVVAACERLHPEAEMILREAGAGYILSSPRDVEAIVQLWQHHCRNHPPGKETLRDRIFDTLPWSHLRIPHSDHRTEHV